MNTRVSHKLIWWVLPLFALRGLMPAGFMIDTSQGEVSIIVCPGHAMPSDSQDGKGPPSGKQSPSVCAFAVAASFGPPSAGAAFAVVAHPLESFIGDRSVHSNPSFGPVRAQLSRGPPFFSQA